MRRLWIISLLLALILTPAASAQEGGYPACTEIEVLALITSLLDYEVVGPENIETLDDLVEDARSRIERRESSLSLLPLCDAAINAQRQVIMLKGDSVGSTALEFSQVSSDLNPYLQRNLTFETHFDELAARMLGVDVEEPSAEADRSIPLCSRVQYTLLDDLATDFLEIETSSYAMQNRTESFVQVDAILGWREENLPQLPQCAQAIELGFLLSKLTTDAAAQFALTYAQVAGDDNPYISVVEDMREKLRTWRKDNKLALSEYRGATVLALGPGGHLPSCSADEIRHALHKVTSQVMEVVETGAEAASGADLAAYSEAHLELRESTLSQLPLCAEVFEYSWLVRQLLGDNAAWSAVKFQGYSPSSNPFTQQVMNTLQEFRKWHEKAEEYLESEPGTDDTATAEREVPNCGSSEVAMIIGYLIPDFVSFLDATSIMETSDEILAVFDQSMAFRDRLWADMPRCQEALEIGMLMRQIAGDTVAMMVLDLAGADSGDYVPYLDQLGRERDRFYDLRNEIVGRAASDQVEVVGAKTYYVTANPYANIRSCASTNCEIVATARYGEGLTVVDDSSDWYEVRLDDGRTAFIAGFLMSDTPPNS